MKCGKLTFSILLLILVLVVFGCGPTLEERKKEAKAQLQLGIAEYNQGNFAEALKAFEQAKKQDPDNPEVYIAVGVIYYHQKKYGDAIGEFHKALRINPNYLRAHNNLGTIYAELKDWDKAIMHFREALKDPLYQSPELAHYNLGLALMNRQRQGDLIEAVKEFHAAVKSNPNFSRALDKYGVSLFRLNRIQEAIKQFKKAIEVDPDYIEPYLNLGLAYMKQGKREEAITQFKHVLEQTDNDDLIASAKRYLEILE